MNGFDALPELMTMDQLAERLGVTHRHVRRLVDERRVPFLRVGRFIRFDPSRDRRLAQPKPRPRLADRITQRRRSPASLCRCRFGGPPHRPAPLFTATASGSRARLARGQAKKDKWARPVSAQDRPGAGARLGVICRHGLARISAKTDDVEADDTQRLSRGSPSFSSDDEVSELFVNLAGCIAQGRACSVDEALVAFGSGNKRRSCDAGVVMGQGNDDRPGGRGRFNSLVEAFG